MKQTANPDASHGEKDPGASRSRHAHQRPVFAAGPLTQLTEMMNSSSRVTGLADLAAGINQVPSAQATQRGGAVQFMIETPGTLAHSVRAATAESVEHQSESARQSSEQSSCGCGAGGAKKLDAKTAQLTAKDDPGTIHLSRVNYNPDTVPVVQRQLTWREGPRAKVKNLTGPILNFTDFGITPVMVNQTEIPPGNAAAALLGPAILINPLEQGGVEASIAAEPINFVGYRMELPTDPPWIQQATVAHANAALGMISAFSISEHVAPDRDAVINVEAKGLPSDAGFAALVEQHENVHVQELIELITEILVPWDARISEFRLQQRVFAGEDEDQARALLFEALGGTAAQVGQRFNDGLRERGLAFHQTVEGSSPTVDSTTFMGGTLRVYWKHPMG